MHAAWGQARLLSGSEPIEKVEESGTLDPKQIERVRQIQEIKEFAEKNLGIKKTDNYTTIYPKPLQDPIHTVSAAPKDKLRLKTWWFPIIGRMPYLGFFDRNKAEAEKRKLSGQGYDVILRSAAAYSTLGWFKDPITLNMLQWPLRGLAEIIIHELTHVTLYAKGQTEFNEGFAQFVGMMGAVQFLEESVGKDSRQTLIAENLVRDELIFSSFLDMLLTELELLYRLPIGYDEKLKLRGSTYEAFMVDFQGIKKRFKTSRYKNFEAAPINNARLLSYGLYHRNFGLFNRVYEAQGKDLKKFVLFFVNLHKTTKESMLDATRQWIREQPAPENASLILQGTVKRGLKTCQL